MSIQVVITDDHPMVITGIGQMLEAESDISITATYDNGSAMLRGFNSSLPDVLLLDIHMPGKTGEELMPILTERYPTLRIITLTGFDHIFYIKSMMQLGALGYVLKTAGKQTLLNAIHNVYQYKEYIDPALQPLLEQTKQSEYSNRNVVLTTRERDVIKLLADGRSSQEISDELSLSLQTIKNYRLNLLTKLDVQNAAGLVRKALELRLV